MSEFASRDAVIAVHPEDEQSFALHHRAGTLSSSFIDRLEHTGNEHGGLRLFSRSVLGQMAVNIVANGAPIVVGQRRSAEVYSPVSITSYAPIGDSVKADLERMKDGKRPGSDLRSKRGKAIEGGRYVDFAQLKRLEKPETENVLNQWLLAIDVRDATEERDYSVNEDGSITMPIALVETLISDFTLPTREERLDAIRHGRAGLKPHIDTEKRQADDLLPSFLVGGVALSPGPFTCVIRELLDTEGKLRQLPGAAMVDGNRLMGIGRDLDLYTGHRQIEIVNLTEGQKFGDTYITIDIYRNVGDFSSLTSVVDWYGMDVEQRRRLHQTGISPLDVIHAVDPGARERLAAVYRRSAGVIMSSRGVNEVPGGQTDKLTANHVLRAAQSFGRDRDINNELRSLAPFVEALAPAGDRSRVFAGRRLLAEHLTEIVNGSDVQSFLVEDYGDEAMSQQVHSAMVNLVRSGVSIGWDRQGEMRIFHRSGLWTRPDEVARLEELRLVIAMYGTHRRAVDRELSPRISTFFDQLTTLMPTRYLAVTHGNGPGVMRICDVLARQAGMMSLGVGIELEGQEEGEDIWLPNGVAHFKDSFRLYRQQRMDKYRMVSVINPGGNGTLEEAGINVCTNKLNSALPSPTIIVDPPGDYYHHIVAQFAEASNRETINIFGVEVDISDKPFAQPWVTNTIYHVRGYVDSDISRRLPVRKRESAFAVIERFWENPAAYWQQAHVPPEEVLKAYVHHKRELAHMGMHLADRFERAVSAYAG